MRISKIVCTVSCSVLLLLLCSPAWADPPELQDKGKIEDGSVDLDVGYQASPTTVDWNNDGVKDLVVGDATGGNVLLYLNRGTNLNPVFNGYTKLEVNGNPIVLSFSS